MSGPLPDWIAEVARAGMSLALIVSTFSRIPSDFATTGTNSLRQISSAAGTKSFHRTMWIVVPCANAGAMRLARMPWRPAAAVALTNVLRFMLPSSWTETDGFILFLLARPSRVSAQGLCHATLAKSTARHLRRALSHSNRAPLDW